MITDKHRCLEGITLFRYFPVLAVTFLFSINPPKDMDFPAGFWEEMGRQEIGDEYGDTGWRNKMASHGGMRDAQLTFNVPVLLGKYSDATTYFTSADFQNMLFDNNSTGSMKEYYTEISHGNFTVDGTAGGWYQSTYSMSDAKSNTKLYVAEIAQLADPDFDYSQFDNDGPDNIPNSGDDDGYVDGIAVVYSGCGAEWYPGNDNLWPHMSNLGSTYQYTTGDASANGGYVIVNSYFVAPELSGGGDCNTTTIRPMGVYAHEFGHVLGLPDLYDRDDSNGDSEGIGNWCLMAGGSWNGTGGDTPAHMSAWCKQDMGWLEPTVLAADQYGVSIPQAETNAFALKIWEDEYQWSRYFLVENRQQIGFDAELPGNGLMIYHVDENKRWGSNRWSSGSVNDDHTHKFVDVEEADGAADMDNEVNRGDDGDTFPGSTSNTSFSSTTNPNSNRYDGSTTTVSVTNISSSSSTMTADITLEAREGIAIAYDSAGISGWGYGYGEAQETWGGVLFQYPSSITTPGYLTEVDIGFRNADNAYTLYVYDALGPDGTNYSPGNLLLETTGTFTTSGWASVAVDSILIQPGQEFFIAYMLNEAYAVSYDKVSNYSGRSYFSGNGTSFIDMSGTSAAPRNINIRAKLNNDQFVPTTVTSVTSTTVDGTYKIDDQINISVNFSEDITVTGTPQLELNVGDGYLSFDGVDDYVDAGSVSNNFSNADFTINAWVKTSAESQGILIKNDGDGSWESGEKAFYIQASGIPAFVGFGNNYIIGNTSINDGNWHYVSIVWDYSGSGSSGTGKVFVDGVEGTSSSSYAANNLDVDGHSITIGAPNYFSGEAPNYFSGNINDVTIWNLALTQQEIQSFMTIPPAGSESGLVGYWNFNEGTGTTLRDQTANGNNGTIYGATWGGATSATIDYSSSSASTLTFNYTVAAGHSTSDLDYSSTNALTLNGGTITDASGNAATLTLPSPGATNSLGANKALVIDGAAPVMTITAVNSGGTAINSGSTTNDGSLTVAFISGESTSNFVSTDITVTGGSISSFSGTGTTYTATFTPSADGSTTIDVAAGTFTDAAGNDNTAAAQYTWTYDSTPPTISSVSLASDNSSIAVTMSEACFRTAGGDPLQVTDFELTPIIGGTATLSSATPSSISASGNVYTLGISLTGTPDGSEVLTVDHNNIFDVAGNVASTSQISGETISFSNYQNVHENVSSWVTTNATFEIESSAGPNGDALKWVEGDDASADRSKVGWRFHPNIDLSSVWSSVGVSDHWFRIEIKTDYTGDLKVYFSDGPGKYQTLAVTVQGTGLWETYDFPLNDTSPTTGANATDFNTSDIDALSIQDFNHQAGREFYIGVIKIFYKPVNVVTLNDQMVPAAFTTGSAVTTGGTLVASKWNGTNTGLDVTVPIADDASLKTIGTVQMQGKVGTNSYANLGDAATISAVNTTKTVSITAAQLEALTGFADGGVVTLTAILTDAAGNATTGTASSTTFTIDQTAPTASLAYTVSNSSGNTVSGTSLLEPGGGYLSFDGVNDYVDLGTISEDFSGGFTVSAWIYYNSFKSWSRIIDFDVGINPSQHNAILLANNGSSDNLTFEIYANGSSGGKVTAIDALTTGVWMHLVASVDNSGNVVLYKNGIQIHTGTTAVPAVVERPSSFIGRSNWSNDSYFDGKIDNITIWSRALTADEILSDYNGSLNDNDENLVSYWNFNEGTGTTLTDQTSNGNNGTINGATWGGTSYTYVKQNDAVTLTATFDENIADSPVMQISGSGVESISATDMTKVTDTLYTHSWTTPAGDGTQTFTLLTGRDDAGNGIIDVPSSGGTIIVDNTSPTFASVTSVSDNTYDPSLSMVGDIVTVTMVTSESTQSPDVTIGGTLATVTGSGTAWTAVRTLTADDTEGAVTLSIDCLDLAGNAGVQATATTDGSVVTFDKTAPVITAVTVSSNNANTALAMVGDIVTVTMAASEITQAPAVTIGGTIATVTGSGNTWTAVRVLTADDTEGSITFSIDYLDLAGNTGEQTTATTDGSVVTFDKTPPVFTAVTVVSNNTYDSALAMVGDTVTVTMAASESTQAPSVTIGGTIATVTGSGTAWTAVRALTADDTEGAIALSIDYLDLAGNAGAQTIAATDGSVITFDKTVPTFTTLSMASNNANTSYAKAGDTVTVTMVASEITQSPDVTIGGTIVTVSGEGTTWTAVRVLTADDTEGAVTLSIDYLDLAGNAGAQATATTVGSVVTFDKTAPVITAVTLVSDNTYDPSLSMVGDTITVTLVASESTQAPDVTIGGTIGTVTGSGTTWTAVRALTAEDTEGTIALSIDYLDLAGNAGAQATATTDGSVVTFDKTVPVFTGVTVVSNNTYDPALSMVGDIITVTMVASESTQSPDVTIGGTIATVTGSGTAWTAVRTLTSDDTEGAVTLSIDYLDLAGNAGAQATAATDGSVVTFDKTPPVVTIVNDGTGHDIAYTGSDNTLSANWPSYPEDLTGIAGYEYAIGTTIGGTDVTNWESTSTDTIFTKTGLSLSNGFSYFTSVIAKDNAGNVAAAVTSNGVIVDTDGPIAGNIADGDSADVDWTSSGTVLEANWQNFSDTLSGIHFYKYAVGTETDSFALAAWQSAGPDTFFIESDLTLISGETYYVFVKATDHVNNTGSAAASDGITVDLLVPEVETVYDGYPGEDIAWQSSDSTLSLHWTGSDTRELFFYEYSVGTTEGDSNTVDWIDTGPNTAVTVDSLDLIQGTTYFGNVRAFDNANNVSAVTSSDGITIDYTVPDTGTVTDGLEADLSFTGTADSLSAHWDGFTDSLSGILHLEYAVGTSPAGSDVVEWTVTVDSSMVESGLSLENGSIYHVSVRAVDQALNISPSSSSNGVVVDITAPDIGTVADGMGLDEEWTNSFTTLYGNWSGFTDTISGIDYYEYAIGTSSGGTNIIDWVMAGLDTSFLRDDLELLSSVTYYISVRATDLVGNSSVVALSDGITVDQISPIVDEPLDGSGGVDLDWQSSTSILSLHWSAVDNRNRGLDEYEYAISTAPGDSNVVGWASSGSDTAVTITGLSLTEGTTYFSNIRAFDEAGNRSETVSSDGITIDTTGPGAGTVIDGYQIDISYTPHDNMLEAAWSGFSDNLSGIAYYQASAGTAPGAVDVAAWQDVGLDTMVIFSDLTLSNAQDYYVSVIAFDQALNGSVIASTNGVVVDIIAPLTGTIFDGSGTDLDLLNQADTLQANWAGFYDSLSGIQQYQVAVGLSALADDQVGWTSTDTNTALAFPGLSLIDASTYYISVRAQDHVGNMSEPVSTDGITIDGTRPVIASQSIASGSMISLTDSFTVEYVYSELLQSVELEVSDMISGTHEYSWEDDHITVSFTGPFASLDTIQISPTVVDLVGNTSEPVQQDYYAEILADYNHDMIVDVIDLLQFVEAWNSNDLAFELAPVNGTVPNLIPDLDGAFNVRDAMTFRRIWYWSNTSALQTIAMNNIVGPPIVVNQSGSQIVIALPDEIKATEIAIQYPLEDMEFSYQSSVALENEVVVSRKFEEELVFMQLNGFIVPLNQIGEKEITIDISGTPEYDIDLVLHYRFMGADGQALGQGSYDMNFVPMPDEFALHQNYPNPFNPVTQIKYDLPEKSNVTLLIYDILGREVAVLLNGEQEPGYHSIMWNGQNKMGQTVGAGMYFYSIQTGQFRQTRKMILLK